MRTLLIKRVEKSWFSRRRPKKNPYPNEECQWSFDHPPRWFILPLESEAGLTYPFYGCSSFSEAYTFYRDLHSIKPHIFSGTQSKFSSNWNRDHPCAFKDEKTHPIGFVRPSKEIASTIFATIQKNQAVRAGFKSLALAWLKKRKLQRANDVDIVTLSAPEQPIEVIEWSSRKIYTFEASTIFRDIIGRLGFHEMHFPYPQDPRNIYTNLKFSLGQIVHIYNWLEVYRKRNWLIENFRCSRFDLQKFQQLFGIPLKFHALKSIFAAPQSQEYMCMLMNFIEDEHYHHNQLCSDGVYRWAIDHYADSERMIKWRNLCYRYHELNILIGDFQELSNICHREIRGPSNTLCGLPVELIAAYKVWKKDNSIPIYSIYLSL